MKTTISKFKDISFYTPTSPFDIADDIGELWYEVEWELQVTESSGSVMVFPVIKRVEYKVEMVNKTANHIDMMCEHDVVEEWSGVEEDKVEGCTLGKYRLGADLFPTMMEHYINENGVHSFVVVFDLRKEGE